MLLLARKQQCQKIRIEKFAEDETFSSKTFSVIRPYDDSARIRKHEKVRKSFGCLKDFFVSKLKNTTITD
jgi:hypothetical protein